MPFDRESYESADAELKLEVARELRRHIEQAVRRGVKTELNEERSWYWTKPTSRDVVDASESGAVTPVFRITEMLPDGPWSHHAYDQATVDKLTTDPYAFNPANFLYEVVRLFRYRLRPDVVDADDGWLISRNGGLAFYRYLATDAAGNNRPVDGFIKVNAEGILEYTRPLARAELNRFALKPVGAELIIPNEDAQCANDSALPVEAPVLLSR